jgi:hypothetical protein
MLFHNCPACDSTGSSRRKFLAALGAAGVASVMPVPAVFAQGVSQSRPAFCPPPSLIACR